MAEFTLESMLTSGMLNLVFNLVFAIVALLVGIISVRAIDRFILTEIDLMEEVQKGNMAAAVYASILLIFVAILIVVPFSG